MTGPAARLAEVLGAEVDGADATVVRILDAARELFTLFGVRRTSIDDVARRARLSRNTVFRRLGSKDELVAAVMQRELRSLIAEVNTVAAGGGSATDRLAIAFALTVTRIRANPMFATAMAHRPDEALELATVSAGAFLGGAVHYVAEVFRADQQRGAIPSEVDAAGVAEVVVRTLHSMVLTPEAAHRTATEQDLRTFAARYLAPLLAAAPGPV